MSKKDRITLTDLLSRLPGGRDRGTSKRIMGTILEKLMYDADYVIELDKTAEDGFKIVKGGRW